MKSQLLDFPREIRDKIYSHAFSPPTGSHWEGARTCLISTTKGSPPEKVKKVRIPGIHILYVNKQLHEEAAELLYRDTQFMFDGFSLEAFLDMIGHNNTGRLRHITIEQYTVIAQPDIYDDFAGDLSSGLRQRTRARLASCQGLWTLNIYGPPEGGFGRVFSRFPEDEDYQGNQRRALDKYVAEFAVMQDKVVKAIPNIQKTTLVVNVKREGFQDEEWWHLLREVKKLGWKIKRHNMWKKIIVGPDEQSNDVASTLSLMRQVTMEGCFLHSDRWEWICEDEEEIGDLEMMIEENSEERRNYRASAEAALQSFITVAPTANNTPVSLPWKGYRAPPPR